MVEAEQPPLPAPRAGSRGAPQVAASCWTKSDLQPVTNSGVPNPVSNVHRVTITCVAALLSGAYTYGSAFDFDRSGVLSTATYSPALAWAFVALLILTVALVNRWWALSVGLVPLAVLFFLHEATDYVYPYHEDPYPALAVAGTAFLLGVSSLGFLVRAVIDRVVAGERLSTKVRYRSRHNV